MYVLLHTMYCSYVKTLFFYCFLNCWITESQLTPKPTYRSKVIIQKSRREMSPIHKGLWIFSLFLAKKKEKKKDIKEISCNFLVNLKYFFAPENILKSRSWLAHFFFRIANRPKKSFSWKWLPGRFLYNDFVPITTLYFHLRLSWLHIVSQAENRDWEWKGTSWPTFTYKFSG